MAQAPIEVPSATDAYRRTVTARLYDALGRRSFAVIPELLTHDHVTEWPQSGERIEGPEACIAAYANYPGGPPTFELRRILGCGSLWTAELTADYAGRQYEVVNLLEFAGGRIRRQVEYFAEHFEQPDWRKGISSIVFEPDAPGEAAEPWQ